MLSSTSQCVMWTGHFNEETIFEFLCFTSDTRYRKNFYGNTINPLQNVYTTLLLAFIKHHLEICFVKLKKGMTQSIQLPDRIHTIQSNGSRVRQVHCLSSGTNRKFPSFTSADISLSWIVSGNIFIIIIIIVRAIVFAVWLLQPECHRCLLNYPVNYSQWNV